MTMEELKKRENEALADLARADDLLKLDNGDFELSDWEANFVASNLLLNKQNFSPKQRVVIDRLREKYL